MKKIFINVVLVLLYLAGSSQTTNFTLSPVPTTYDLVRPGAGANYWFNSNVLRRKAYPNAYTGEYQTSDSTTNYTVDDYVRINWAQVEAAGSGTAPATVNRFDWSILDIYFKQAIDKGGKVSFGILTISTGYNPYGTVGGAALGYPTWLHNVMQAEALVANRDYIGASTWVPNWNHTSYLAAIDTLMKNCAIWINSTSYTPASGPKAGQTVQYKDALNRVDIRGYGNFGEWNLADIGAGSGNQNVTKASLQAIVNSHKNAFPNHQLQMLMEALVIQPAGAASGEFNHWMLTQSNNVGKFGYRMDNWGQDIFNENVICNPYSYNPGTGTVTIQSLIDNLYKYAPVDGEPSNFVDGVTVPLDPSNLYSGNAWCGTCDLNSKNFGFCATPYPGGTILLLYGIIGREVRQRKATSFGNGNFGGVVTSGSAKDSILSAWREAGARIQINSGSMTTTPVAGSNMSVVLGLRNIGSSPCYENFLTELELRTSGDAVVKTWAVPFRVRGFLPAATDSILNLSLSMSGVTPGSGYKLVLIMRDSLGYRKPYPLSMAAPAQAADGSFTLRSSITVAASGTNIPPTANAGSDQSITLPTSSVALSGSGSDVDGVIISYSWSQISGTAVTITNASAASTTITGFSTPGTYTFRLTVTDDSSTTGTDDVIITVNAAPVSGGNTMPIVQLTNTATGTASTANTLTGVTAGALLVLTVAQPDDISFPNASVSSTPSLTWTKQVDAQATNSGNVEIYTATFTAGGSITVNTSWGVNLFSSVLYAVTNYNTSSPFGGTGSATLQTSPSVNVTTTTDSSLIFAVISDWAAVDGTSRVYRSTPVTESFYTNNPGNYTAYHFYKKANTAGIYALGTSTPTGQASGAIGLEIKGAIQASAPQRIRVRLRFKPN